MIDSKHAGFAHQLSVLNHGCCKPEDVNRIILLSYSRRHMHVASNLTLIGQHRYQYWDDSVWITYNQPYTMRNTKNPDGMELHIRRQGFFGKNPASTIVGCVVPPTLDIQHVYISCRLLSAKASIFMQCFAMLWYTCGRPCCAFLRATVHDMQVWLASMNCTTQDVSLCYTMFCWLCLLLLVIHIGQSALAAAKGSPQQRGL